MEAPKCRLCGEKHWGSVCNAFGSKAPLARAQQRSKLPSFVTKPREVPRSVPQSRVSALEAEVERLEGEVKQLKKLLAEANAKLANTVNAPVNTPVNAVNTVNAPVNAPQAARKDMAAYMRKRRAAAKAGRQDFKG